MSEICDQPKPNCLYTNVSPAHLFLEFIHKVLCGHTVLVAMGTEAMATSLHRGHTLQHAWLLVSAAWHGLALDTKTIKCVKVFAYLLYHIGLHTIYIYIHICAILCYIINNIRIYSHDYDGHDLYQSFSIWFSIWTLLPTPCRTERELFYSCNVTNVERFYTDSLLTLCQLNQKTMIDVLQYKMVLHLSSYCT